jgi:hypothetical protein
MFDKLDDNPLDVIKFVNYFTLYLRCCAKKQALFRSNKWQNSKICRSSSILRKYPYRVFEGVRWSNHESLSALKLSDPMTGFLWLRNILLLNEIKVNFILFVMEFGEILSVFSLKKQQEIKTTKYCLKGLHCINLTAQHCIDLMIEMLFRDNK